METLLEITGVLLMGLALLHTVFPRHFRWKDETAELSLVTRQILYVHTFFIALTVFLMGLLCLTSAKELMHTALGRRICLGLAVFWGTRLCIQFFGYSSKLWRGKVFESVAHFAFTLFWVWLTALFLIAAWFPTVFFIAKTPGVSSISSMVSRLLLIVVSSSLVLASASCCCLF